jgi:hypothetical protein
LVQFEAQPFKPNNHKLSTFFQNRSNVLFKSDVTHAYIARAFFIWASVFNLFIVSVFWSFMADIFNNDQANRLFGAIAAGGTSGALTGPVLTAALVNPLGPASMLLVSVVYRGGDAVSAWAYAGLKAAGISPAGIALIAVPLAGV